MKAFQSLITESMLIIIHSQSTAVFKEVMFGWRTLHVLTTIRSQAINISAFPRLDCLGWSYWWVSANFETPVNWLSNGLSQWQKINTLHSHCFYPEISCVLAIRRQRTAFNSIRQIVSIWHLSSIIVNTFKYPIAIVHSYCAVEAFLRELRSHSLCVSQ